MQDTKLTLGDEEADAIMNSRFFIVKRDVTEKIFALLGILEKEIKKKSSRYDFLTSGELPVREKGKIFRGENYRTMPYILLDYPRVFTTETVFAFRSMFLWGNEFSFTLHLQGKSLELFRENIIQNFSQMQGKEFFFCVNDSPWEYSFDETNYKSLDELIAQEPDELKDKIRSQPFIKFSRKLGLKEYEQAIGYGLETFELSMNLLK